MSEKYLTWSILKKETGITDERLNVRVEEKYLLRIAELFGNCRLYARILDLTEGDIEDVRLCAIQDGNTVAMLKALTTWLNTHPFATYKLLIDVMIHHNQGLVARKLAEFGELRKCV